MDLEKDIALLRGIATFDVLDAEALRILAISAEQKALATGEVLFRAGEMADCGYVLISGVIEFVEERRGGARRALRQVGAGSLLGEAALIAPTPRPATAVAIEPVTAMRISRSTFLRVLEGYPEAAIKLRRTFAKRLEQTLRGLDKVRAELENTRPSPRRR